MKTNRIVLLSLLFFMGLISYAQKANDLLQIYSPKGSFSLRSNAVTWLLLTPNIGFEYKVSDNAGLILDGGWAQWSLNNQNRHWNIWNIAPQARLYVGQEKASYLGVQYTMGDYNLIGTQGSYMGGGLSMGHQFSCGRNLLVDLGLTLGYLHLYDTEEYTRKNGIDVRTRNKYSHGYWGPTGASITFVWKIN